jgi:hypothetical protein
MAKGKRAVALFEVIRKDKRFDRKGAPAPEPPPIDHSRQFAKQAVEQWRKNHSDPETWMQPGPSLRESIVALRARLQKISSQIQTGCGASIAHARLWISRSNGVIPGIGAAAVVIFAMLSARHFFHPGSPIPAIEDAIRAEPPHPAVLTVGSSRTESQLQNPPTLSPEMMADEQQASQKTGPTAAQSNLAQPGQRVVNMHYVLMQSYFEEKTAQEARDFLARNGIPCTIERGVKGWRPDFFQVIGLQGFARASGPQYLAYRQHVEDLGERFSPRSRYKRFQPQAIKW